MSEPTNITVVTPIPEEVPQKTPFYKNPRVLKTAGVVAATAAATAIVVRKFSSNGSDEDNSETDTTEFVIED